MPDPIPAAGVSLAGGRAERFGGIDKGPRRAGRPPASRPCDRPAAAPVAALALNTNGDPTRFAAFGLPVIPDPVPDQPDRSPGSRPGSTGPRPRGLPPPSPSPATPRSFRATSSPVSPRRRPGLRHRRQPGYRWRTAATDLRPLARQPPRPPCARRSPPASAGSAFAKAPGAARPCPSPIRRLLRHQPPADLDAARALAGGDMPD